MSNYDTLRSHILDGHYFAFDMIKLDMGSLTTDASKLITRAFYWRSDKPAEPTRLVLINVKPNMYHSAPEKLAGKPDGRPDWSHVCRSYGGNADFILGYAAGVSLGNLAGFPV